MTAHADHDVVKNDKHNNPYLALFAFLTIMGNGTVPSGLRMAADKPVLKTLQRYIRIPYTLVVFLAATASIVVFSSTDTTKPTDFFFGSLGLQAIAVFMPAFVVHTTQGINSYIFRRCHIEIIIFCIGVFGITLAVSTLYVTNKIADDTWPFRESLLFSLYMSSVERLPMTDALFEEGVGIDLMFPLHNQGTAMAVGFLMGTATVSLLDLMSVIGGNSAVTVVVSGTYLTYYMLENMSSSGVTGVVVYTMAVNLHRSVACTELARALEE
ncbi:hypothetical protein V5799_022118 [Amblyomma americanum]|uniref:Uncharacterized protein n=1 Tax=Amblyomma americanum TaxID=6943 RepID=A0AAQ4FLX6_AMBAM